MTSRSSTSPRSRRGPRVLLASLAAALVVVGVAAGGAWYLLERPARSVAAGSPVKITIVKGSSTSTIAEALAAAGVVDNALRFRLEARKAGLDGALKAGAYTLQTGMGYDAALAALEKGPEIVTVDVVIPEGFTATQVAARFAHETGVPEEELRALITKGAPRFAADYPFLEGAYRDSLEGYLFPATYRVREGASAEQIVRLMLDRFESELDTLDLTYAESKRLDLHDVVVIASAVEREARLDKERPLVASVIYNRLKAKMRLQLCATVLYELPGKDSLTLEDLKLDSPYNTYIHAGLPPGPISNPGSASLKAAANPPKTKYLYYVLTGKDGSHTYATNYQDFLKAKRVSRQVFGD